jgi:hypothetical protein
MSKRQFNDLMEMTTLRLQVVGLFILFFGGFLPVESQAKESQTISVEKISSKVYGVKPFKVKALASSKLPVSILVSGPAEIDQSGILSVKGVGMVRLIAIQNGNKQFIAAKPILLTFEVTKAELTVIAEDKTINKGETAPELTIDYRGFVNGDSVNSLKKTAIAKITETGTGLLKKTRIVPSGAESPNYTFKYLTGVLKVNPKKN